MRLHMYMLTEHCVCGAPACLLWLQSLLNSKQARWAKEMLANTRLACCVAGGMKLVPKEDDLLEVCMLHAAGDISTTTCRLCVR